MRATFSRIARLIFFGNYFYGICALALSVESSLQQGYPLNEGLFYILLFCTTVLYYSKAYLTTEKPANTGNLRSDWYARNRRAIFISQWVLIGVFLASGALVMYRYWLGFLNLKNYEWVLLLVFPMASALYYGFRYQGRSYNIRKIGGLKPFIIGFIWSGLVSVYPLLYYNLSHGLHLSMNEPGVYFFIKNMMFVSVLCIMFDIKDYEMDYNYQLKTFAVKLGPNRTIFMVILPLCLVGFVSFLAYATLRHFSTLRILLNAIPFFMIAVTGPSLRKDRPIFYYLVIIDGLMLLKALCGIAGLLLA